MGIFLSKWANNSLFLTKILFFSTFSRDVCQCIYVKFASHKDLEDCIDYIITYVSIRIILIIFTSINCTLQNFSWKYLHDQTPLHAIHVLYIQKK